MITILNHPSVHNFSDILSPLNCIDILLSSSTRGFDTAFHKGSPVSRVQSSQDVLPETASALPVKQTNSMSLTSDGRFLSLGCPINVCFCFFWSSHCVEILWQLSEGSAATKVSETNASDKKDVRFRRTSSCNDAAVSEASFMDMLKKPVVAEADTANGGAMESADGGVQAGRSGKKKGKKGRHIDPALLGFKVSSNRIMMGEIHRLED